MDSIPKAVLETIDQAALKFYEDKTEKRFEEFVKCAHPLLTSFANRTCSGSEWNSDDLFSILLADVWRLLNVWTPDPNLNFHYLMLRQLKNKSINFVNKETRVYSICRVCGYKNKRKNKYKYCCNCHICLLASDTFFTYDNVTQGYFEKLHVNNTTVLDDVSNKDLVYKLINSISDMTTKRIVVLYYRGNTKAEIEQKLKLPKFSATKHLDRCRKLVKRLTKERSLNKHEFKSN
jgi:DNA-directed RNA polymerase specialized sigma24 family protein